MLGFSSDKSSSKAATSKFVIEVLHPWTEPSSEAAAAVADAGPASFPPTTAPPSDAPPPLPGAAGGGDGDGASDAQRYQGKRQSAGTIASHPRTDANLPTPQSGTTTTRPQFDAAASNMPASGTLQPLPPHPVGGGGGGGRAPPAASIAVAATSSTAPAPHEAGEEEKTTTKKMLLGMKSLQETLDDASASATAAGLDAEGVSRHKKRTMIVSELLQTERTYVATLGMLVSTFLKPLRKAAPHYEEYVR